MTVEAVIESALTSMELTYESSRPGSYLVKLPGTHKLQTMVWLVVDEQALNIEAFFCRGPDENHQEFYRWLLAKNGSMYGVHFALDHRGDVHLVGRIPHDGVTEAEVDRLLGCVLTYADELFDPALEIGFATSIRREWEWRLERGESTANLQAFARFADPER
ncbi:YbjN domain-containing protein [Herbidospora cretacea]|uniref:YbjN domain-containing protein n=1 Tax=Herbidospora cretacea TaxID=28444 RepID=UPI000772ECC4|nr:YbjN domain-containing protein [Herbidospora cretacea]